MVPIHRLLIVGFAFAGIAAAQDESGTPGTPDAPQVKTAGSPGTIVPFDESIRDFTSDTTAYAQIDLPAYFERVHPDVAIWYQHVNTLANPFMEGRQPGTRGDELAAQYIEFHLSRAGLEPAFSETNETSPWRQPFRFQLGRSTPILNGSAVAMMSNDLEHGEDYTVLANSGSGQVTAPVTFVGYAIEDGVDGYDSFGEDDDLSGRIAIMLRYEPLDGGGVSRWSDEGFSSHAALRGKMAALVDRGADGIIMVTPPKALDGRSGLESLRSSRGYGSSTDMPVIHLDPDQADALLSRGHPEGLGLAALRKAADRDRIDTVDLSDAVEITINTDLIIPGIDTHNVGGVIPGSGDLADEWLVIGGHYDHLGTGYTGSRRGGSNAYHNGADDNASGTASLLVLADRLSRAARDSDGDRRSVMIIGFGAEEAGLHGSDFFVENPPFDLDQVTCMINFDMMGRLGDRGVQMLGTGTAVEFDDMLPRHVSKSPLLVNATPGGRGPSDHANFYAKGIPVLFFFSGITDEYHTPDDEAWTVNPEGAVKIIDLATSLAEEMITRDDQLTYQTSNRSAPRRGSGSRVRLGIIPDYQADIETGVLLEGVSDDTAAAAAGLQRGDILVGWNETALDGARELMEMLRASSPGDTVQIKILREGKTTVLPVTLRSIDE